MWSLSGKCDNWHVIFDMWNVKYDLWLVTCYLWLVTFEIWSKWWRSFRTTSLYGTRRTGAALASSMCPGTRSAEEEDTFTELEELVKFLQTLLLYTEYTLDCTHCTNVKLSRSGFLTSSCTILLVMVTPGGMTGRWPGSHVTSDITYRTCQV